MNRRIVAVNLARTCEPFPLPIALTSGVAPPSIAPPPSHLPIRGQPTIPYNIISSSLQFLSPEISPISEPTISSNLSRCVLTSRVPSDARVSQLSGYCYATDFSWKRANRYHYYYRPIVLRAGRPIPAINTLARERKKGKWTNAFSILSSFYKPCFFFRCTSNNRRILVLRCASSFKRDRLNRYFSI